MIEKEKITVTSRSEDEEIINLYEEEDYFIRSPRFMEVIEEKNFIIDRHPSAPEPDDTPLILTVGPMLTMGMSSVVMLMVSINSYQSGNSNSIISILPMGVMSISMLAGTILWPTLSRKYTKKSRKNR